MIRNVLASACPLILCAVGALFSEYAGSLALFMEGLISFSAFLAFYFSFISGSANIGFLLSIFVSVIIVFCFGLLIEKMKGQRFIAAISLNLLFSAVISLMSNLAFGTRGVLTSNLFTFKVSKVQNYTICFTVIALTIGIYILRKTKLGLYIRITGSDSDVLMAKGVNPVYCRIASWCFSAFFAAAAGGLLVFRLSSFVPNISSGRGWMALAAVFLGKKKAKRIIISVFIFCLADILASNIQNVYPFIPSSVMLSLPYIVVLLMIFSNKEQ